MGTSERGGWSRLILPMGKVAISESRAMGSTESNWCRAVGSGTGVTVTGLLFSRPLSVAALQAALADVSASQPLLRARIVDNNGTLWFEIKEELVLLDMADVNALKQDEASETSDHWLRLLEMEMNTACSFKERPSTFQPRLHILSAQSSLLVLRFHPAVADIASVAPVSSQILRSLKHYNDLEKEGHNLQELLQTKRKISDFPSTDMVHVDLPAMEKAIPPTQAKKPFWTHGLDVVGYGLASMRHSYLPFEASGKPTASRLLRLSLSESETDKLLRDCQERNSDLYGVLTAACLKAVARFKKVGSRGEHYGVVSLLNCRKILQPQISEDMAGFYHAAIMKTVHVSEEGRTWELAARCTREFNEAVKNRKHFTDMADLNMLMMQAINHANLTPGGTMRTALLSIVHDPMDESHDPLEVDAWATCSSTHGVGPCLAIFPFLRNGSLRISIVYCTPLFSPSTIQTLVDFIHQIVTNPN